MKKEYIQQELAKFNVADAAIEQLKKEYMPLKINGIKDTKGYKIVHAAHMAVKKKRVEVEKKRKELKADSLAFGRAVDAEAKRITALLTPIEEHLAQEKQAILDEKARIKAEAERKERERKERERAELEARIRAEAEARAEEERKKQEAAARLEAERLAKIRAEQEAERQRLAAIAKEQAEREAAALAKAEEERLALERERQAIKAERERLKAMAREHEAKAQEPEETEPEHPQEVHAHVSMNETHEHMEPQITYSLTLYGIASKEQAERIAGEHPELSCRIDEETAAA